MTTLSPEQRQALHDLALSLIEADFQLGVAREKGTAHLVMRVERRRDALRKEAAQWIVELDRRVNAPLEA